MQNQLAKIVAKLDSKPRWLRNRLLDFVLGSTIKFIGTAGLNCTKLTCEESIFVLKNKRKVRNHIGTVHAAATSLLAETASGMALGMNIPDDKLPLLKSMKINYLKRSTGALTAVATISQEQISSLYSEEKGETEISVTITDEAGIAPVECKMLWAWIPKKRV